MSGIVQLANHVTCEHSSQNEPSDKDKATKMTSNKTGGVEC